MEGANMRVVQRVILILGAILFLFVMWATPPVQYGENGVLLREGVYPAFANVVNWRSAMVHGLAVLGATGLLVLAFWQK